MERAGIPFEWSDENKNIITGNAHIFYPSNDKCKCSVIQGQYTYGGEDNLLEIMGLLTNEEREGDDVKSWLSAEEVFDRIKRHWEAAVKGDKNE